MLIEAASLAVMSALHLTGVLDPGHHGIYAPNDAGIAEAVIGVVLLAAGIAVLRSPGTGRRAALWATAFAVVGFCVGISITIRGGNAIDIAYHSTVLPILVISLIALARPLVASRRRL